MDWKSTLDVIIEYSDEDQKEKQASLLRSVNKYGQFGPMAEYETSDGEKFWIDGEYFQECKSENKLPRIPVEVIRVNEATQKRIEAGMQAQSAQNAGLAIANAESLLPENKIILPN